ncbi:MAG: dTDP-glucose 46-dehydratase [Ferruginibacter sp.]|nr:dTDP-glucose 46-dehydratase [Ferruginibacter sp.]
MEGLLHPIIIEDVERIVASIEWEKFLGKTILISGANGFLASYLVHSFLLANDKKAIGSKVIGICRNADNAAKRFKIYEGRKDFQIIITDVAEPFSIEEKIDFIFHAASQASPKYYGTDPVGTMNANILGTNQLLSLANKNKVAGFLYFSSSEVYGVVDEKLSQIAEKDFGYIDLSNVRNCYSEGKRAGEVLCLSWWHQFKVPVKIVRPFHTYGPGMQLNDGRVYADFVAAIVKNQNITLNSEGTAIRAFCYLADATIAFLKVMLEGAEGDAYNVGNPDAQKSILELAEMLVSLFPEKNLSVERNFKVAPGYIASTVQKNIPAIKKIKSLKWTPDTDIADGFKRTIKSYI